MRKSKDGIGRLVVLNYLSNSHPNGNISSNLETHPALLNYL